MKKLYAALLFLFSAGIITAQNPAGNCFRIDYDDFQATGDLKYFNCGNDNMLNLGSEMTLEVWIQFRDLGDNQKIIGKFNLNSSGYILGVDQGRIYPEVWNPTQYDPLSGLMNPLALHWQHLAVTFTQGDSLRSYINGQLVNATAVTNAPITQNTDPLIIGISSWGNNDAFQSFGNIDEVRIWDVARTQSEIQGAMFNELSGNESGLVAYYDFNQNSGNNLPDVTGNGNDGTGNNVDATEWVDSRAVIANAMTEVTNDLQGLWNGMSFMDPRVASTDNGMTLVASGLDTADYIVFGHNNDNGTSTADLESIAPANFERTARVWTMTEVGSVNSNVLINLSDAAGSGTSLDDTKPAVNYTLLFRNGTSGDYTLAGKGASITNGVVTFSNINLNGGEYVVGVGDTEYEGSVGIEDLNWENNLSVFPNPSANGQFNLTSGQNENATITVYDVSGKVVLMDAWRGNATTLDLSSFGAGMYTLMVTSDQRIGHRRLVVR